MSSDTLTEGLKAYRIGPKVRDLRTRKNLGLQQLGDHSGLSPGMLSKIERGQLFPTLPTLLRIAMVFGVGLDHFFSSDDARARIAVVRREDRLRLPDRLDGSSPGYLFESLDFPVNDRKMTSWLAEFQQGAPASPEHRHEGAELIYVISGRLSVDVDGLETVLAEGDAMYFESGNLHSYRCEGSENCTALVVTSR